MLCAEITADGFVRLMDPQPSTMDGCDHWIGDGASFALWQIPPSADLALAFWGGFTIVALCYLAGWAVGSVANFFNRN